MKFIKPFRNDLYSDIDNPLIDYVRKNYQLDNIYDLRQRGDDKWGTDLVKTDNKGNEEVIWRGWYPEDIIHSPRQEGNSMFPGVSKGDTEIQLKRMSWSLNQNSRMDVIYIICPTKSKSYDNEPVRWEVYIGYMFNEDISNWRNSELNNKRIKQLSDNMSELENKLKIK